MTPEPSRTANMMLPCDNDELEEAINAFAA
jgi:hypothetical protein